MIKNETKNSDVVEALDEPVKPRKSKSKTASWAPLLVFVAFLVGMLVMTLVQAQRPQNLGSDASGAQGGYYCSKTYYAQSGCKGAQKTSSASWYSQSQKDTLNLYCRDGEDSNASFSNPTPDAARTNSLSQKISCWLANTDEAEALQKCVIEKYAEYRDGGCRGRESYEEVTQPIAGGYTNQSCTEVNKKRITCTPIEGGGGGGGGAEPEPTSATGYGERCLVKGRVEYFDNLNLRNASNVIQWNSGGPQDISTNADGVYSINKRYSNVWDTFELKVNNPYLTYRTFAVKGAVPNGCSVINNGTTIRCNKSVCYERNSDLISFNFEEIAPSRPNSKISNVNNLTYGQTLTWTVEATDADSNLQSTGVYLHSGTPAVGETQGWTVLKWTGGLNTPALTYRHNDATGVRAQFVCDASKVGTWTITTNAVDTTGLNCSGNPVSGEIWCASHPNDRKTFTCAAPISTPRAEISYPAWGASWSVGQMNSDPNLSKIIVAAKGDPNKQYDVIAYIHKIPFSSSANAWSIATTTWTCDNTYGKWAELSRISVPKGRLNSSTGTTITLPAIDWGKVISQGGLNPQPGFRYLINVNVVSTTFREDGLDTSVCTGSPAKDPATGKACFSSNWCNFDKSRGTGNMFKIITLNP